MYKKVPPDIKVLAKEKEGMFRSDPFDSRLKTHKLHGPLQGAYAFSINYRYRVVFDLIDEHTVLFQMIGTHDVYD